MTYFWENIEDEQFRRVAEYWDQVRGDRLLPRREDIKFADFPGLAALCTIMSRSKEGELLIWYGGSDVLLEAGLATPGTNLLDAYPESLRRAFDPCLSRALSFPCSYITHYSAEMPDGQKGNIEVLSLPLSDQNDAVRYVLTLARSNADDMGAGFQQLFQHVSRLRFRPIDIGAGCPEAVDVTAETDFK